jgi:predicted phosphodiesterase
MPDERDAARWSCAAMWQAIVERAIKERVDAVILTGDVVDQSNKYFEATGPLERGLRQLADARIPTLGVAGNHDHDVLPRIADSIPDGMFRLLGRAGHWESAKLAGAGGAIAHIHGWSFPAEHVRTNPLDDYRLSRNSATPVIGILHADVDVMGSAYCPVALADLQRRDVDVWLLGHVHKPTRYPLSAGRAVLYPGSPQAMDPGETGVHGPWLIHVHPNGGVELEQIPLSHVVYETVAIDAGGVTGQEDLERRAYESLREHLAAIAEGNPAAEFVSMRVELTGRTNLSGRLADAAARIQDFVSPLAGVTVDIDRVWNRTRPAVDLDELSRADDPPGLLARLLIRLQDNAQPADDVNSTKLDGLVDQALEAMNRVHEAGAYGPVARDARPTRAMARAILAEQTTRVLEALLSQKEGA